MSSKLLSPFGHFTKTASFRLAATVTVLLSLISLLILAMAYRLLAASLASRDQEAVAEKFWDIQGKALSLSPEQLHDEIGFERKRGKGGPFFVRLLAKKDGRVVLQHGSVSPQRLNGLSQPEIGAALRRLPETKEEPALEIISRPISEDLILQVAKSAAGREDVLRHFRRIVLSIMIGAIASAAFLGAVLSRRALRPVRRLIVAVKSIRAGNLSARVPESGVQDELDELGLLFNEMLDRIESLVAGMRRALDDVAHELRTPLTRLRGTAEVALRGSDHAAQREALAECIDQADVVISMTRTLMDISEAEHGALELDLEPVDLGELLREAEDLYRFTAEEKGVRVSVECPYGIILRGDRNRLRRVVGNLLDNALKYSPRGGSAKLWSFRKAGELALAVSDTGPGISEEDMPRVWDRLYRGQAGRAEKGLGLGLSLVKAFVTAHRGRVEVESPPGAGATFTAYFPL